MFLKNNNWNDSWINDVWNALYIEWNNYISYHQEIWTHEEVVKYNNTKPYMEQSENFYKKLNEWLISEFNIKL